MVSLIVQTYGDTKIYQANESQLYTNTTFNLCFLKIICHYCLSSLSTFHSQRPFFLEVGGSD